MCHVNEVGSILVVPGAWIAFEKLHVKERQRIMFLQANSKQFSGETIVTVDQRE